jgi:site-specific recombinase XerD
MPCHRSLAEALRAYIDLAGIAEDRKGFLFRTWRGYKVTALSERPMTQPDAWRMIRRRTVAAGIHAAIGNHSFRATGIAAYLSNGGALEHAQEMAAHESPRTTKLYDRTKEPLTQDEVERIRLWKFRTPRSSTRWCSVTRSHEARFRACQAKRSREKDRGCVTM